MIGFVSQLTHAVAVSLMNTSDNTHLKEYTGDSFRDLTRIAKINETLWSELFFLNKKNLVQEIDDFVAELENLKQKIADEDEEGIKNYSSSLRNEENNLINKKRRKERIEPFLSCFLLVFTKKWNVLRFVCKYYRNIC